MPDLTDFQRGFATGAVVVLLPIGYGLFLAWLRRVEERMDQRRAADVIPIRRGEVDEMRRAGL